MIFLRLSPSFCIIPIKCRREIDTLWYLQRNFTISLYMNLSIKYFIIVLSLVAIIERFFGK